MYSFIIVLINFSTILVKSMIVCNYLFSQDADKGWKDYFYIITDPNEGGIIYINKTLDREVVEKIVIKVTAIDRTQSVQYFMCDDVPRLADDRSQPLEITVLIDDINDSPPVFKKKSHSFGFLSSTEFGKTLITLPVRFNIYFFLYVL